jgi:hypothetical protein
MRSNTGLFAIAMMSAMMTAGNEMPIREKRNVASESTLNGKQKTARKSKNNAAKVARKRNR